MMLLDHYVSDFYKWLVILKKINENVTMSFRVNNEQLLKNYDKIWGKVEKLMRIDFESKPVYGDDDKYLKTKIKNICGEYDYKFS